MYTVYRLFRKRHLDSALRPDVLRSWRCCVRPAVICSAALHSAQPKSTDGLTGIVVCSHFISRSRRAFASSDVTVTLVWVVTLSVKTESFNTLKLSDRHSWNYEPGFVVIYVGPNKLPGQQFVEEEFQTERSRNIWCKL